MPEMRDCTFRERINLKFYLTEGDVKTTWTVGKTLYLMIHISWLTSPEFKVQSQIIDAIRKTPF